MANVIIKVNETLVDGHKVSFNAPCGCSEIDKLDIRYMQGLEIKSQLFTLKDANGNDLGGISNVFGEGAIVKVILDVVRSVAFIQNADTNGYLESRLGDVETFKIVDSLPADAAQHPTTLYIVKG